MEHDGCKLCKYESFSAESKECLGCKQNAVDKYKKMTQGDRIRAMSDEELAEWIHNITQYYDEEQEPTVSIYDLDTKKDTELHDIYGDLLKWLQSEVEE